MSHQTHSSPSASRNKNMKKVILIEPSQVSSKKSRKKKNSTLPKFYNEAKYSDTLSNLLHLPKPSRPPFKPWINAGSKSNGHRNLSRESYLKDPVHMSAGKTGIGQTASEEESTCHQKKSNLVSGKRTLTLPQYLERTKKLDTLNNLAQLSPPKINIEMNYPNTTWHWSLPKISQSKGSVHMSAGKTGNGH